MNLFDQLKAITTFVLDVDGVLTDGSLILLPGGAMARTMNVKDGYAMQLAIKRGYQICVISGGFSAEVEDRLHRLGVTEVHMRVVNKMEVLTQLLNRRNISQDQVLYMGDDVPDLEVMRYAAIASCPADAVHEIKAISAYISPVVGGRGCVRDVIEKVLRLRGHWTADTHIPSA